MLPRVDGERGANAPPARFVSTPAREQQKDLAVAVAQAPERVAEPMICAQRVLGRSRRTQPLNERGITLPPSSLMREHVAGASDQPRK
jgi:hypothetical protein